MKLRMRSFSLFLFCLSSWNSLNAGWHDRKAEGWAWYEDKLSEKEKEKQALPIPTSKQVLKEAKKELEEKLAEAILDPSETNIAVYITLQKKWADRSSKFSQEWSKVLLNNPELDTTVHFPTSYYGRLVEKKIQKEGKEEKISSISRTHSLFFFYEGSSKISQASSVIVQEFGKRYDWNIVGISCDGNLLNGFNKNQFDQGMAEAFEVYSKPALFVVNPSTKEAFAIAYGLVSLDTIENNMLLQIQDEGNK